MPETQIQRPQVTRRKLTDQERQAAARLKGIFERKKRELGLTQQSAALEMGWSAAPVVNQYLNGHIPLGMEAGLKFAKLLQVQPSEINPAWADYDDGEPLTPEQQEIWDQIKDMDDRQLAYIRAQIEIALPLLKEK